jgi:ABC-type polysaccharide/polyol phosphate transport system ATPase subunit
MARLEANDIHLTYPLLQRTAGGSQDRQSASRDKIVRGPGGIPRGVRALQGVSVGLEDGDRLAIIGHNGSGKTTLLHVLAGLLPPDRGEVLIEGRLTSLININLGVQSQATGRRNIMLRGLAAGLRPQEIDAATEEIAAFSELDSFLDLPVETYSSGMRMRLNFSIATAFRPDILVLDEWISTGDAAFREKARKRMAAFADEAAIVVLASHNLSLLRDVCNKALWLTDGEAAAFGPAEEVLGRYEASTA